MKLISQFKNKYNKITYKTYETENGIKVLHLDNPATTNFDLAIMHNSGSAYEDRESVPRGTAHFLEHMLLNPNKTFKTKDDINKFEQGSIKRPAILINAYTNKKYITFTASGNEKGKLRMLNRLEKIYQFPKKKFFDQLEKERGIVLAEKSREVKRKESSYLSNLDFLFTGIQDEFTGDVLGEPKEIKKITINDLERYFFNVVSTNQAIISIQSNGKLDNRVIKKIENISKKIGTKSNKPFRKVELKNTFRIGSFSDKRKNGITISFMYFEKEKEKIDYKEYDIKYIYSRLLEWLTFEILREKKSLIYAFSPFKTSSLSYDYGIYGYRFTTEKEKIKETLNELYTILYKTSFEFLKTEKGKEWFNDVISTYIFPKTVVYDDSLGDTVGQRLFKSNEIFNYNIAVREAKKMTIKDLEKHIKKQIEIPPHIWIESDMSKEDMIDIINRSPFYKRFSKQKK